MSQLTNEPRNPYQASNAVAPAGAGHPRGFWFFFWGEFAERCSYYGMRSILPIYLTTVMAFPDTVAGPIYYWFKMTCYFLPLVGGYLADRYFGKYWTIVGFSVPYVLGHFILGIEERWALFVALGLLAGGSGVIKPNISSLMGLTYDQQRPGKQALRSSAFQWFYFSINVGALLSQAVMPTIRTEYGYGWAFALPAWVMVISLAIFAAGKRFYAVEVIERRRATPEERAAQWATLRRLFGLFAFMVFFWVAYEHNDSLWVYFIRDYVDRAVVWSGPAFSWGGNDILVPGQEIVVAPDQMHFLNPLFVLIFIPLFNVVFRRLDPHGRVIRPLRKIMVGFLLTAVAVAIIAAAGFTAQASDAKVSLTWIVVAYIVITAGEVLFYGTALEMTYSLAPQNMKGFVTACFMLTNTIGNFINTGLSRLYGGSLVDAPEDRGLLTPGAFFSVTSLIVVAATVGFYFVGRRFERQSAANSP